MGAFESELERESQAVFHLLAQAGSHESLPDASLGPTIPLHKPNEVTLRVAFPIYAGGGELLALISA